jgi:cyclophilin family peptidyl-prolyl cis-trans isomerase
MKALLLAALIALSGCTMTETIILETTEGDIMIELYHDQAPQTAANFLAYTKEGHFDGLVFHRVMPGFMIQGGGFTAEGEQRPTKNPIALETTANLKNERGTIAMARTNDPDSATSQFFINLVDNEFLNPQVQGPGYAVFGKVVGGMDVVDRIAEVRTANRGPHANWPVQDVVITRAYVKN